MTSAASSVRLDASGAGRALLAMVVLAGVALAGGYALAVGELQALYVGLSLARPPSAREALTTSS